MKNEISGEMNCRMNLKKVRLGSLNAGMVFAYHRKLWIVLNPCKGGKLVRTLEGSAHTSKTMPSGAKVWYVLHAVCGTIIK